uniref:AMP-activated protein kinase, gamma regulatory subunit n=1 Tax=Solanum tuberosum TaxID=4113 RepID=M1APZ6_SOLTU
MYPSAMDYARDGGTALIPTRFVWPYGGRSVYLSGTFTGWSQWPMAPVEGCPTVFQTVCSVPPGYHQYKFIVDGEWRHDENQPFVSGSLGTVNTVLLARESDYLPAVLSAQIPPSSNMDVDNQAFQRLVRVSDVALPDDASKISQSDLDISRHRISAVLSTHSAYELLPGSTKVIALDVDLPVKQAFHILHEQAELKFGLNGFERSRSLMRRTTFSKKAMEWIVSVLQEASKDSGTHRRRRIDPKVPYADSVRTSKWQSKEASESLISNKNSCIIISGGDANQENGLLGRYIIGSFSGEEKEKLTLSDIRKWVVNTWKNAFGVKIYQMGVHSFLFEFPNKHMVECILKGQCLETIEDSSRMVVADYRLLHQLRGLNVDKSSPPFRIY